MKSLRFDLQVYCVQKIFLSYGNWIERKIGGTLGDQRPVLRERRNNGEKELMKMEINTLLTVPRSQRIRRVGKKKVRFLVPLLQYKLRVKNFGISWNEKSTVGQVFPLKRFKANLPICKQENKLINYVPVQQIFHLIAPAENGEKTLLFSKAQFSWSCILGNTFSDVKKTDVIYIVMERRQKK